MNRTILTLFFLATQWLSAGDLLSDLVGRWSFENNVLDVSGSNLHGTATGSPSYTDGTNGKAIVLGTGKYVDLGNTMALTNQLTISAWVCITNPYTAGGQNAFLSKNGSGVLLGTLDASGQVRFYMNSASITTTAGLSLNTWHHVAATYNGTTATVYLNGTAAGSTTGISGTVTATGNWLAGARSDSSSYNLQGLLDELVVYRRALTAAEIGELRTATAPLPIYTNVLLYGKVSTRYGSPLAGVLAWVRNPTGTTAGAYSLDDGTFTLPVMQGTNVGLTFTPPRGATLALTATNFSTPWTNFIAMFTAEVDVGNANFKAPGLYSPQSGDLNVEVFRGSSENTRAILHLVSATGMQKTRIGDVPLTGHATMVTVPADSMRRHFATGSYILEIRILRLQADENDPRNIIQRRLLVVAR